MCLGSCWKRVERLREVVDRLVVETEQVVVAVADDARLVDDDHRAFGAKAVCRAVRAGDGAVDVGKQRHVEVVLGGERGVRVEILRRDANDGRIERSEVAAAVAVGAELARADRSVVAWVEEEDDALAAVLGELERPAGARQLEVRRRLANLGGLSHEANCLP